MAYISSGDSYVFLTFEEAQILSENLKVNATYEDFFERLDKALKHTQDKYLIAELSSLIDKLKNLTPNEFIILQNDVRSKKVMFMPNYILPRIE